MILSKQVLQNHQIPVWFVLLLRSPYLVLAIVLSSDLLVKAHPVEVSGMRTTTIFSSVGREQLQNGGEIS